MATNLRPRIFTEFKNYYRARRAVLVHISPRYKEEDVEKLAGAAAQGFERAEMGKDFGSGD
jgi:ribonuclease BN (tRNA processing enzyme)